MRGEGGGSPTGKIKYYNNQSLKEIPLDSDNIANMQRAFDYLKTQFDFVLIITHLDSIKDYTDSLIPIDVKNGFSQVVFT